MTGTRRTIALAAIVVAASLAAHVYGVQNGFVDFDDDDYVFLNPHVTSGITWDGVRWAFTTGHAANYHPLTWLSHMADVSLWGLDPFGPHLVNIALHAANSLLVFWLLLLLTARVNESWTVALIFAVHPLHVESVAWISERKDLLCAFFSLLSLAAYARYTRHRTGGAYALVAGALVAALLSKPMAVTIPFLLLVLDYWPLHRARDRTLGETFARRMRWIVLEKLPLFVVTVAFSAVTYLVQRSGGAMAPLYRLSIVERIQNAIAAYVLYLWKLAWPHNLSAIYPRSPTPASWWTTAIFAAILISISFAVWTLRRRAPYLLAGWLWYVVMLVPVIGIVPIGYTAMADRYMYLPMLGVLTACVWAGSGLLTPPISPRVTGVVFAVGFIGIAWLVSQSQKQTTVWHTSVSLFSHAIAVTPSNAEAYAHLGIAYLRQDKPAEAIVPLEAAVRIRPGLAAAHTSLGVAYRMMGRPRDAIKEHRIAVAIEPNNATAHANLGVALTDIHQNEEAETQLREALRLDPAQQSARNELNRVLRSQGKTLYRDR